MTGMTITTLPPDEAAVAAGKREAFLAGLRALEALLSRVSIPLPNSGSDAYFVLGPDEEARAEVARIARALGVEASVKPSGLYVAEIDLGGGVAYRAVAVPAVTGKALSEVAA